MPKKPPKPLFGFKHEFYDSLDNALQQAMNLMQAVDQAIEFNAVKPDSMRDLLKERSAAMRAALMPAD